MDRPAIRGPRRKTEVSHYRRLGTAFALATLIAFLCRAPATAGEVQDGFDGKKLPALNDDSPILAVQGSQIRAQIDGRGRLFLLQPNATKPFGCAFPSAQLMGETNRIQLTHDRTQPNGPSGFTQDWISEAAGIRLRLEYGLPSDSPWIDVRLSLINTDAKAKQVRAGLHLMPAESIGEAKRSISFRRGWITSSEAIDTELDRDADGKPQRNWDGYNCNPSPRFSLAQAEFQRLTHWVQKYQLDGISLDLYADTTGIDPTRTYAHFPFYPMQVAEIEWTKLLADWCNQHGKILCLNCPHPSLMVSRLAGLLCGDTAGPLQHVSMVERMMAASTGKPHLLLGPFEKPDDHGSGEWLRCSLRAMFYGELICQWQPPLPNPTEAVRRDVATVDWLFRRNLQIGRLLADAELQGGDTFTAFWFRHPSGQGFITLNNETTFIQRPRLTLDRYIKLERDKHYQVVLWDLTGEPVVLGTGTGEEVCQRTFQPAVAPGQVKVVAYVNDTTAAQLLRAGKE